jgi:serine/threonine-protein kinase RsbW
LSLIEAALNAIIHGNKKDPSKKIFITYEKTNKQINLSVKDMGEGFDYNNLPDSTSPRNIDKPNGRGLFIISNFCNDLSFNDKGNEIKITFRLK